MKMPPRRILTEEEKEIKRKDLVKGRKVVESNRLKKKELEILKAQYPSSSDTDSSSDEDKDEIIQINPDEQENVKRFSKDIKLVKRSEVEFLRQELENVKRIVASKRAPNDKKKKEPTNKKIEAPPDQEKIEPQVKVPSPKIPSPIKPPQTPRQSLDEARLSNILMKKSVSNSSLSKEDRVNNLLMRMRLK
jgi:hypothetical protein